MSAIKIEQDDSEDEQGKSIIVQMLDGTMYERTEQDTP